ncbi:proteinase-activated receptor 1-like [Lithobates pipiens]
MEVHLLLPLFLLHGIALFCAVKCVNMTEEFLVDNHTVTQRPTTMQNVTPPQCDNCTKEMTKHYMTTVLRTNHTTQGPSPPPSPREYILIGESGKVYLRIKATFIVILNFTKIRNVTIPSPPITKVYGRYGNNFVDLAFVFPGGELWLIFRKNEKESLFYLETIWVGYLKHIQGEEIHTNTSVHLKTFITPLGHYFTSKEVNLLVAPDVSVVFLNAKVQAFEVNGGNFGNDNATTFVKCDKIEGPYYGNYKNPFIHWGVTKLIPSIYTVVFLVALPLNIISIVIFLVKMKVRKPAVVYMLNLAIADVLLVSVLPFHIVYRFLGSDWIFGEVMCRIVTAAFYCNMGCCVQLMASISVDRFLAIVYPVRSLPWRTVTRAWLVCGVIWVISLASFVPLLMKNQIYKTDIQNICHEAMAHEDFKTFYFFFGTTIISLFFLPQLCIITFSYIGIIRSLHRSNVDGTHKRTRAIRLTVVVLSVFVFSFLPIFVIYLIHYVQMLSQDDSLYVPYMVCTSISSINCCLDPLIYYFATPKKYFYRLMCCKKNECTPIKNK